MKESVWFRQKCQLKLVSLDSIPVVSLDILFGSLFWQPYLVAFPILIVSRDDQAALQIRLLKRLFWIEFDLDLLVMVIKNEMEHFRRKGSAESHLWNR